MTDLMGALRSFTKAFGKGTIRPQICNFDKALYFIQEVEIGRTTHAKIEHNIVHGIVAYCGVQSFRGLQCFAIGYAVAERMRGRGIGTSLVSRSIEEFSKELQGQGLRHFYLEAIVDAENEASNRLACKVISSSPNAITEKISQRPAFQYMREICME